MMVYHHVEKQESEKLFADLVKKSHEGQLNLKESRRG